MYENVQKKIVYENAKKLDIENLITGALYFLDCDKMCNYIGFFLLVFLFIKSS